MNNAPDKDDATLYATAIGNVPRLPDYKLRNALSDVAGIGNLSDTNWQRWCDALKAEARRRGWNEKESQ